MNKAQHRPLNPTDQLIMRQCERERERERERDRDRERDRERDIEKPRE